MQESRDACSAHIQASPVLTSSILTKQERPTARAVCDHLVVMLSVNSAVRSDLALRGSIRSSRLVDVPTPSTLRTSVHRSLSQPATGCLYHNGNFRARQQKNRRSVARFAAATEAEPIAYARTDIAEPEEEDFYSILGVVCVLCLCCSYFLC